MRRDRRSDVFQEISRSGYHPQIVSEGLQDALAGEEVRAHVVHHEPTFDRDEVRRHMTVLVLTDTRVVLVHTDEHPPDDLLPAPYTSTTSEAVAIEQVRSVVVSRMVSADTQDLAEAVMTIGWGAVSRIDLEPAQCSDPECEADHGYTGNLTGDDFSLRLSAAADGGSALERLLEFARVLSVATTGSRAGQT
ncbi:DUF5998 family protein [Aeromicrobium sp. CF4.19]|uniref:DUF5998 family protein n=1 Tax=Aeromicrobium sp. CF4.19 TaxID=3373082 RepID=UPI003EE6C819